MSVNGAAVAAIIHKTLTDPRGWQAIHPVSFERTDKVDADLRIILATPTLTDKLCLPLDTGGEVSCRVEDRVVLNAKRWMYAVPAYAGNVALYRSYLVNHEVGHALGHGHSTCTKAKTPAPVMMQQTKGLAAASRTPGRRSRRPEPGAVREKLNPEGREQRCRHRTSRRTAGSDEPGAAVRRGAALRPAHAVRRWHVRHGPHANPQPGPYAEPQPYGSPPEPAPRRPPQPGRTPSRRTTAPALPYGAAGASTAARAPDVRAGEPVASRDPRAARVVAAGRAVAAVYGLLVVSVQRVALREISQAPGSPLNHPLRTDVIDTIGQLLLHRGRRGRAGAVDPRRARPPQGRTPARPGRARRSAAGRGLADPDPDLGCHGPVHRHWVRIDDTLDRLPTAYGWGGIGLLILAAGFVARVPRAEARRRQPGRPGSAGRRALGVSAPVVLVPGLGLGPESYARTVEHLTTPYHVITLPGYGEPAGARKTCTRGPSAWPSRTRSGSGRSWSDTRPAARSWSRPRSPTPSWSTRWYSRHRPVTSGCRAGWTGPSACSDPPYRSHPG